MKPIEKGRPGGQPLKLFSRAGCRKWFMWLGGKFGFGRIFENCCQKLADQSDLLGQTILKLIEKLALHFDLIEPEMPVVASVATSTMWPRNALVSRPAAGPVVARKLVCVDIASLA